MTQRPRVLVIDDVQANVTLLERAFATIGCAVIGTTSASDGLVLYQEHRPDLVLLDLHMPGLNGLEVLTRIRELAPDAGRDPVLMVTAEQRNDRVHEVVAAGISGYVLKPITLSDVLERARGLIEKRRRILEDDEPGDLDGLRGR